MGILKDAKYGMTKEQLKEAVIKLGNYGVNNFGIHAFLASNTKGNGYYPKLASILFELAVEIYKGCNAHIGFINLFVGIDIDYNPEDPKNNIQLIGEGVKKAYEEILIPEGMGDVKIFTELGRSPLTPYGHLVSKVLQIKHIWKEYV